MKCWICGVDNPGTGEHFPKASDLRLIFGHVTQKNPLYLHTDENLNQIVQGIQSDKFKFPKFMCANCNNERTKPHDDAWKTLLEYLIKRHPPIRVGDLIRLDRPFPGKVAKSMLAVHLFFLKLFGCLIVEQKISLNIDLFSQSILDEKPHPKIWIAFWTGLHDPSLKHIGCSEIKAVQSSDGKIVYATWFYVIDKVAVNIIYAEPGQFREGLVDAWHPSTVSKRIRIVG